MSATRNGATSRACGKRRHASRLEEFDWRLIEVLPDLFDQYIERARAGLLRRFRP